jgi:hypothetical protein
LQANTASVGLDSSALSGAARVPVPVLRCLLLLACLPLLTDFCLAQVNSPKAEIRTTKIFDDGLYNCFTDLVQFNNVYYCTFRSAMSVTSDCRNSARGSE